LKRLWLDGNKLMLLPTEISELRHLTFINVRKNQISKLPGGLFQIKSLLRGLFDGNPLVSPPLSIIKQGIGATRRHLAAQERGKMPGGALRLSSSDRKAKERGAGRKRR
jgi:hypothetical protein